MSRPSPKPNGAYKLLTTLLYHENTTLEPGSAPRIVRAPFQGVEGYLYIRSLRRLARALGTDSRRLRSWIEWLAAMGYLLDVVWTSSGRSVIIRTRPPGYASQVTQVSIPDLPAPENMLDE